MVYLKTSVYLGLMFRVSRALSNKIYYLIDVVIITNKK